MTGSAGMVIGTIFRDSFLLLLAGGCGDAAGLSCDVISSLVNVEVDVEIDSAVAPSGVTGGRSSGALLLAVVSASADELSSSGTARPSFIISVRRLAWSIEASTKSR